MRVVIDTNIFVSALILPGGRAEEALIRVIEGTGRLILSKPILGELLRALGRDHAAGESVISGSNGQLEIYWKTRQ